MLPEGFADLEPFAATWCLATEPERWARRLETSMLDLRAFYDACFPRAEAAIAHCDRFDLHALPADTANLLQLLQSFALVSYAIEVWGEQLPLHTGAAVIHRTSEPRP
jgi:hypothetical protein